MPKFEVTIIETLTKSVIIEANDKTEAFYKVLDGWKDGKHILCSDNFCDVEFEVCPLREDMKTITRYDSNGFML